MPMPLFLTHTIFFPVLILPIPFSHRELLLTLQSARTIDRTPPSTPFIISCPYHLSHTWWNPHKHLSQLSLKGAAWGSVCSIFNFEECSANHWYPKRGSSPLLLWLQLCGNKYTNSTYSPKDPFLLGQKGDQGGLVATYKLGIFGSAICSEKQGTSTERTEDKANVRRGKTRAIRHCQQALCSSHQVHLRPDSTLSASGISSQLPSFGLELRHQNYLHQKMIY